ncbi:MAG TPA: primosomal protein N' [Candidatus Omnitrophota bacterium]|nr:primosomal protein N' [Candidatus Omnitrophota bacterium]
MTYYAQIVLDVPVDGPFDYSIPADLVPLARAGCRVKIDFRNKRQTGYIVSLSDRTDVRTVKPVIAVIDKNGPVLTASALEFARRLSEYYYCSWGTAIAVSLPAVLRRGSAIDAPQSRPDAAAPLTTGRSLLVHDRGCSGRIRVYKELMAGCHERGLSVILLAADKDAVERMRLALEPTFGQRLCVLIREGKEEIAQWMRARNAGPCTVIGTRSAVFAPVSRLGCIIVDDEHDYGYKQDQAPHYHGRTAAMMRCAVEHAHFVAGSPAPSLEMMHAVESGIAELQAIPRDRPLPLIKIVDMKRLPLVSAKQKISISGYLQEAVRAAIASKQKTLIFFNRTGYATLAVCSHCGKIFQCPRCSVNLHFHYEAKALRCHYCNFSMEPPSICPECNAGYVRFLGAGAEKLESELFRIFPQATVRRWESGMPLTNGPADIIIATQAGIRHCDARFNLVALLGIDNALNHADFRSAEKTFQTASCLAGLADAQFVVQTNMADHYVLRALARDDPDIFYQEESRLRRQLSFPPYRHFCLVKVRAAVEEKARAAAQALFDRLSAARKPARVNVLAVSPGQIPRLRGNYYWQVLCSGSDPVRVNDFLKKQLPSFRHSGIIVTVDVDPV